MSDDRSVAKVCKYHGLFPTSLFLDLEHTLLRRSINGRALGELVTSTDTATQQSNSDLTSLASRLNAVFQGRFDAAYPQQTEEFSALTVTTSLGDSANGAFDKVEQDEAACGANNDTNGFSKSSAVANREVTVPSDSDTGFFSQDDSLDDEIAYLKAIGVWTERRVDVALREEVVKHLEAAVVETVHSHLLAPHLSKLSHCNGSCARESNNLSMNLHVNCSLRESSSEISLGKCILRTSVSEARMCIMRNALALRYGSLSSAVRAAKVAGPPLILYVRDQETLVDSYCSDSSCSEDLHARAGAARDVFSAWKRVSCGTCAIQLLDVDDIKDLRQVVSSKLKNAVRNEGLFPILTIVEFRPSAVLFNTVSLLRAICEPYGAMLHIECSSLPALLLSEEVANSMDLDMKSWLQNADSVLLDISSWFGHSDLPVVEYQSCRKTFAGTETRCMSNGFRDDDERHDLGQEESDARELSSILTLWWLLNRVNLHRLRMSIAAACAQSLNLLEISSASHKFLEVKKLGSALNVLVSCTVIGDNASQRERAHHAILKFLLEKGGSRTMDLSCVRHEGANYLLHSPLRRLYAHAQGNGAVARGGYNLATEISSVVLRCRAAHVGSSVFAAVISQSSLLEQVDLGEVDTGPVYFGAVRVVPLGLAARNGRWKLDKDMEERVTKLSDALANAVAASRSDLTGAITFKKLMIEKIPFVCVGPIAEDVDHRENVKAQTADDRISNKLHWCEEYGKRLAQYAAEFMIEAASSVVDLALSASRVTVADTNDKHSQSTPTESTKQPSSMLHQNTDQNPAVSTTASLADDKRSEPIDTHEEHENSSHDGSVRLLGEAPQSGDGPRKAEQTCDLAERTVDENASILTGSENKRLPRTTWLSIFGINLSTDTNAEDSDAFEESEDVDDFFRP